MRNRIVTLALTSGLLAAMGTAVADHPSKNGEGWANMPNDIHNTRIETREADDNEAFRDFVKYGEGSKTDNRFATDDQAPTRAKVDQSKAQGSRVQNKQAQGSQDKSQFRDRQRVDTGDETMTRTRSEKRDRVDSPSMSRSDRASRSQRSSSGNRRGGKR